MHWAAAERKGFFLSQNYLTIECQVVTSGALKAPAASLSYGKCEDENFILKQVLVSCPWQVLNLIHIFPSVSLAWPSLSSCMQGERWHGKPQSTWSLGTARPSGRAPLVPYPAAQPSPSGEPSLPPHLSAHSPLVENTRLWVLPCTSCFPHFPSKSNSFGELRVTMNIIKWRKRQERVHKGACSHRGKRHTAKLPLSFYCSL